jgi:hypothetical protein
VFLFGGDAVYDLTSGLYLHGDGTRARSGFSFIQLDEFRGNPNEPLSLNPTLYAVADPIAFADPSGHFSEGDVGASETIGEGLDGQSSSADAGAKIAAQRQAQVLYGFLISMILGTVWGIDQLAQHFLAPDGGGGGGGGGGQEDPQNPGDHIFVHGGTTAPTLPGPTDFGNGYYAFAADQRGIVDATAWARRSAAQRGGTPFIEFKSITDEDYNGLSHVYLTGDSFEWLQTVSWYRQPNAAPGGPYSNVDIVIGPLATKSGSTWRAVRNSPDQYAFKPDAEAHLVTVYEQDVN